MAGEGLRFKKAGYCIPKHEVSVRGKTLFEWALRSLENFFDNKFIFVVRKSDNTSNFVETKCKRLGIRDIDIKEINYLTTGQAATAMEIEEWLDDSDEEIIIYNIDTYVEAGEIKPEYIVGYGWVPVFIAEGDKWSFAKFGADFRVIKTTEKVRISEYGTIGLYYFKSFNLFKEAYIRYYKNNSAVEKFIAPIYNILIENSKDVYAHVVNKSRVHVLGAPEEVKIFEENAR